MPTPLPLPLEDLDALEVERLRPVLDRLRWERHVRVRVGHLVAGGASRRDACERVALEETVAEQRSISPRTVRRIVETGRAPARS